MIVIAIIILIAYLIYAYCKVGIPYCLSDTAYTVGKGIFASAMIATAACMWFPLVNSTSDEWQFVVFLAFAGIAILAVSPYKDSDFNYKLHYVGTCMAMLAVIALYCIKGSFEILAAVAVIVVILYNVTDKWLLWTELIMFALMIAY